ncbi:MAG TPA: alpha-amylase family glycosyl hydrolase [Accumulibacter sp.]|uniref:alpha-amylase family glycosyl hydrolase n=1 Tax=Accumulibacter sp. TaxID=2053492 RepID=UPI002CBA2F32|nr:alpha-amylase family glycosyl hydrolase [Accumulibacter sp.]HRD87982.1 alpha-amylase family glycosyl hydrolase [Accumulibacter sp.]
MSAAATWWQSGVIYQVYPRSFQDSNGDGVGDLAGIVARLDYLHGLNVDIIWLSPIYPSPMHDFGYDVADYCAIDPLFGSMADFDRLLAEVHRRGMRLLLDLVPNHSSHRHPWFIASRSSRDDARRAWYIWRDPAPGGGPPNNWLSHFGGPAWTFDQGSGQYYMHQFLPQQPELNYRHPEVLPAMLDCMRFWLDKGVDGFRVDVIGMLLKDPLFRDEPANPAWNGVREYQSLLHVHTANLPEVHGLIRQMRGFLDGWNDRLLIGELYLPNAELVRYYGDEQGAECHLPFNFQLIRAPWDAALIRRLVDDYEALLPQHAWPNWVLGNHDQKRLATRVGSRQARVATMLLLTLRGTPTCYYGDEIGMLDVPLPLALMQDPPALRQPEIAHLVGRDPQRTPMQWDASANAGFAAAGVHSWLPLAADWSTRNVASQSADPNSPLGFFRTMSALRRAEPALGSGSYRSLDAGQPDVFAYLRGDPGSALLVLLNFGAECRRLALPLSGDAADLLLSTAMTAPRRLSLAQLVLEPDEGMVLRLPASSRVSRSVLSGG